jgi:aspartate kinase
MDHEKRDRTPLVMKFGGSSVADLDQLRKVAALVVHRAQTQPVVVVVSAMGKTTDALVAEAQALHPSATAREMDMLLSTGERKSMAMLALAVAAADQPSISLTGSQCGIITDHRHGRARVVEVRPFRILDELAEGRVVIVGGFQGVSYKREVTTLGRGGSDTTAVALAAAMGADCEIYSDVDGIYSTDPRVVPQALRLEDLSFASMRAMSRAGAKVLHAQAVRLAEQADISIFARATDGRPGQSQVRKQVRRELEGVRAIVCDARTLFVHLQVPAARTVESGLLELGFISLSRQGEDLHARAPLSQRDDAEGVETKLRELCSELEATILVMQTLAAITCVGTALEDDPEVLERAYAAFAQHDIAVVHTSSEVTGLCFGVAPEQANAATRALHAALVEQR